MRSPFRPAALALAGLCLAQVAFAQPLPAPEPRNPVPAADPNTLPPVPDPAPAVVAPKPVPEAAPKAVESKESPAARDVPVTDSAWKPSSHWRPLGNPTGGDSIYGMRVGSPYYYTAGGDDSWSDEGRGGYGYGYGGGDLYDYHFGPGYHRHSNYGHYRFPFYSYRRPWYFPGPASYGRDTNYPW